MSPIPLTMTHLLVEQRHADLRAGAAGHPRRPGRPRRRGRLRRLRPWAKG